MIITEKTAPCRSLLLKTIATQSHHHLLLITLEYLNLFSLLSLSGKELLKEAFRSLRIRTLTFNLIECFRIKTCFIHHSLILSPSPSIPSFSLKFHASFSLKSPTSTFCAFSDAEEDEDDDEEEDPDQDNVSTDEYDDVSGEASDEADVFARHGGFKWQRVDKLCNEVREFGTNLIDVDELASVYDFRIDKFQRQAILAFLRGFSVVVSAPTSSRKMLIAEAVAEYVNGLQSVSVEETTTGYRNEITITNDQKRLSAEEIIRMIHEAKNYQVDDRKFMKKANTMNAWDDYVYKMRNALNNKNISSKLCLQEREKIKSVISKNDWSSRKKVLIIHYVMLKWGFALLIGLGTGLVGFFNSFAVENIAGFKLFMTTSLMSKHSVMNHFPLSGTVLSASILVGFTTSLILFCSHFHQVEGDREVGKMSPLVPALSLN
ncbi:hypothetical protein JHK84_027516 [Glycine max]|nr:hypothetical protein JHK84_027516 [Glycine max]